MKILGNAVVFVILYLLFMFPTYLLPYVGSNSALVHGVSLSEGLGLNPFFWMHLFCLLILILFTWFRGSLIDRKWLIIFPILATVFDLAPGLSMVPLIPTIMHLLAIIIGVVGANTVLTVAQENTSAIEPSEIQQPEDIDPEKLVICPFCDTHREGYGQCVKCGNTVDEWVISAHSKNR